MTTKSMTTQQEEQLQTLIDRAEVAYERAQVPQGEMDFDLEEVEAAEESIFGFVNDLLAEQAAIIAELRMRLSQADGALEKIERDEQAFAEMNEGWEKAEAERSVPVNSQHAEALREYHFGPRNSSAPHPTECDYCSAPPDMPHLKDCPFAESRDDESIDPDDVSPELHDFLTDQSIDPSTLTRKRLGIAERLMNRENRRRERAEGEA